MDILLLSIMIKNMQFTEHLILKVQLVGKELILSGVQAMIMLFVKEI